MVQVVESTQYSSSFYSGVASFLNKWSKNRGSSIRFKVSTGELPEMFLEISIEDSFIDSNAPFSPNATFVNELRYIMGKVYTIEDDSIKFNSNQTIIWFR